MEFALINVRSIKEERGFGGLIGFKREISSVCTVEKYAMESFSFSLNGYICARRRYSVKTLNIRHAPVNTLLYIGEI